MLTQEDKLTVLREFPNVKLSYEKIIHKKVYDSDLLLGIPDGKKCFAWFTSFKDKMLCIILEVDDKNKKEFTNIRVVSCCFSISLCYGTLLFGTLFYHMNNPFFTIEDIHMYKGSDIYHYNHSYKINKISNILKNDITQISYNNYFVVFGLPIIAKTNEEFEKKLATVSYKLTSVQYCIFSRNKSHYTLSFDEFKENALQDGKDTEHKVNNKYEKPNIISNPTIISKPAIISKPTIKFEKQSSLKKDKIFICKPDIQNDIYHLYSLENEYAGVACIPDYKTSVMMNKLFRIIKENNDLDALEESDDEEEFENENIDKFVHLNKSYKISCIFNNKFKKWFPIKIIE
jgi:hypothetical protein